jgi:hypothetical protein
MIEGPHRYRTAHDHPYAALVAEVGTSTGNRTVGLAGTEVWAALQTVTRCVMVDLDANGNYAVRVMTGRRGGAWDDAVILLEGNVNDVVLTGYGQEAAASGSRG